MLQIKGTARYSAGSPLEIEPALPKPPRGFADKAGLLDPFREIEPGAGFAPLSLVGGDSNREPALSSKIPIRFLLHQYCFLVPWQIILFFVCAVAPL